MTKISPFSDPPFSIFHKKITKKFKKIIFFSLVKFWAVLHHLKKEWILFTMKWAWNEFLHLWISKMSIDMGKRIVQCDTETGTTEHLKKWPCRSAVWFLLARPKSFWRSYKQNQHHMLLVPSFKYLRDHFCDPIVMITSVNVRFSFFPPQCPTSMLWTASVDYSGDKSEKEREAIE